MLLHVLKYFSSLTEGFQKFLWFIKRCPLSDEILTQNGLI